MLNRIRKWARSYRENNALKNISKEDSNFILNIREKKLTYLSNRKLVSIIKTCQSIEKNNINGIFIEAGCALGGSTILISHIKDTARQLNVYDVFDMIPPPSEKDSNDVHERYESIVNGQAKGLDGEEYYGYKDNLLNIVISNIESFQIDRAKNNINLIKGLVQDTLNIESSIAFAHIDVDWYDPVKTCLDRIFPNLQIGGSIILDDYFDWGGCRKAADEFISAHKNAVQLDSSAGSLKITKNKRS